MVCMLQTGLPTALPSQVATAAECRLTLQTQGQPSAPSRLSLANASRLAFLIREAAALVLVWVLKPEPAKTTTAGAPGETALPKTISAAPNLAAGTTFVREPSWWNMTAQLIA